jgi:excisionase family DNA binding protein
MQTNTIEPMLLSVKQVGDLLGVRTTKTYQLLNRGEIDTVRIGARRLVRLDSVKAFIDRSTIGGAS